MWLIRKKALIAGSIVRPDNTGGMAVRWSVFVCQTVSYPWFSDDVGWL